MTTEARTDHGTADTLRLWRHLYGDSTGYMRVFSGHRPTPDAKTFDSQRQHLYPYPVSAEYAEQWLKNEDDRGWEAYSGAHLFKDGSSGKGENAAPLHALYVDGDGAQVPATLPQPTAIVDSSPGRQWYFWRLTHAIEPAKGAALNRRLAHAMGADKSGWDLSQIARVPGLHNHKYPDTPIVQLVHLDDGAAYDPDELDRILPPLPAGARAKTTGHAERPANDGTEPPIHLDDYARGVWAGETVKRKETGDIDRSASLFHIGAVLWRAGAARRLIVAEIQERDQTLGWNRYIDRPAEYERIVDKLEEDDDEGIPYSGPHHTEGTAGERCPGCIERERTIATLQHERDEARATLTLQWQVFRNRNLKATDKLVALSVVHRVADAEQRVGQPPDADGFVHVTIGGASPNPTEDPCRECNELAWKKDQRGRWVCSSCGVPLSAPLTGSLAEVCGVSRQRVSAHLDRFQDQGFIDKRVTRSQVFDPESGETSWQSETKVRLKEPSLVTLERLAHFEPAVASEWGGKRDPICPKHPNGPTITVTTCAAIAEDGEICGRVLHRTSPKEKRPCGGLMLQDATSEENASLSVDRLSMEHLETSAEEEAEWARQMFQDDASAVVGPKLPAERIPQQRTQWRL